MNNYLQWLEKQIEFCLNDQQMQKEHWAFCRAYEAYQKLNSNQQQETLTPHVEHHSNGKIRVKGQQNSKGEREGVWEWFYKNGNIELRIPYKNHKIDGILEEFYENGNISKRTHYKNGEVDGILEEFYENGNISTRIPYKNGEMDGIVEWFYENGNIERRIPYKKGEMNGIQEVFDEQGNIIRTRH